MYWDKERGWIDESGPVSLKLNGGFLPRGWFWVDLPPSDQAEFNRWAFGKNKGAVRVKRTQRNQSDGWEWVLWEQQLAHNEGAVPYPYEVIAPPNTGLETDTYETTHDRPVVTLSYLPKGWDSVMSGGSSTATKVLWAAAVLGIGWIAWSWKR